MHCIGEEVIHIDDIERVGRRIKERRESLGMSQEELAAAIGYKSRAAISRIESGQRNLRQSVIYKLAQALHVTPAYLVGLEDIHGRILDDPPPPVRVPVLGYVAAGLPISCVTEILDYEEVTPEMAAGRELFALRIKGDSMAPKICDGDIVICSSQQDAESGEICIVQVCDGDAVAEATCKKVRKHHDGIELIPTNPAYETQYYPAGGRQVVHIIGKVLELRRTL